MDHLLLMYLIYKTESKSNNKALASTAGAENVAATGTIAGSSANATLSTPQLASHSHSQASQPSQQYRNGTNPGFRTGTPGPGSTGNAGSGQGHSHNLSANFTGDAVSVLQPYLTIIYIIKT